MWIFQIVDFWMEGFIFRNYFFCTGYGKASLEKEVQPDSLFRIASVSKTLTAIGILKLLELEKLKLTSIVFGPKGNNFLYFWMNL